MINWKGHTTTLDDLNLMVKVAERIEADEQTCLIYDKRHTLMMDLECTQNDTGLDLQMLLESEHEDFIHDVFGIKGHMDRTTGKLMNCFLPRCSGRTGGL